MLVHKQKYVDRFIYLYYWPEGDPLISKHIAN